jgi:hypothetical protein
LERRFLSDRTGDENPKVAPVVSVVETRCIVSLHIIFKVFSPLHVPAFFLFLEDKNKPAATAAL